MQNRVALLGPNGQPMPSRNGVYGSDGLRDDGFRSKHVSSFSGIIGSISKTYRFTYDEALKRSVEDARAMRRDGFMTALLKERIAPTGNSKYHLEPEDKNDVTQKWVTAAMTDIVADIPRFTAYRMQAMQAVWFGRYGNQIAIARKEVKGKPVWGIADHQPVNGDKIVFRHDGTPGVMISQMFARDYENQGATVGLADRGPVLFLDKPAWRERFLIHMHEAEDADFQEPELAGGIHGVGLRHWAFWIWWMRSETISWLLDYLGRVGAGGLTMIGYEQGNAAAKEAAEVVANDLQNGNIILCPMPIGSEKQTVTITRVEPSQVGSTVLIDIVDKFFESKLERLIVGQSMSSGADNADGLGGTGRSELAANTKFQLIKIDSQSLDETLTEQLIKPLQRWNFPWAKWKTKFVSDLATPDPDKQLDAVHKAWEMGVSFDENEIRSLTGMAAPKAGDPVLKKSPETPQLPGMGAPGQPTPEQRAAQAIASVDGEEGDETDPDEADANPEPGKGIAGERPKQYARWEESKHPRDKGKFAEKPGEGAASEDEPSQSESDTAPAKPKSTAKVTPADDMDAITLKPSKQRAFSGEPVSIKTPISKQESGRIGEAIVIAWLKQNGFTDARHLNLDRNNYPIDLIQDHKVIEAKTGLVSNGPRAQQWRMTIGEPGKSEKAWLAQASDEDKAAANAIKQRQITERKEAALAGISKKLGKKVGSQTITVLLNPDTKTADIYVFDGWHNRIGWKSSEAQSAYKQSVKYG